MKLLLLPLITFLSLPIFVFAQGKVYSPLVDLSNAGAGNDVQTFEGYINFLYGMSIAVAALLAVIKIIIAGTKYMLSDIISNKSEAIKDIQGAVLGLLLILSAVIILELINPELINKEIKFDELRKRPDLQAPILAVAVQKNINELQTGCGKRSETKTGGGSTVILDATICDDPSAALGDFVRKCNAAKGSIQFGQRNNLIAGCGFLSEGAAEAASLANSIANKKIINTTQPVGALYVGQSGATITTNVAGACDNNVKDLPAESQKGQHSICMTNLLGSIKSECSSKYGNYTGSNTNAVTCQLPDTKKPVSELTDAFEAYKAADPSRKYDTFSKLGLSQEEELCERYAGGTFYDENGTDNTCLFFK
ncbi:MAG: hypothetical protein AAB618_00525 [Patescibacteria group bacterium]